MKRLFTLLMLGGTALNAAAQGLWVGYDVPYPSRYQIRPGPDGRPYIVVQEFERRQTGDFIAPQVVGVVQQVRASHGGGAHVTLRASNGLTFGVVQGQVTNIAGRPFRADGFVNGSFVLTCMRSGQSYLFSGR